MPKKVESCVTSFVNDSKNQKKWPDAEKRKQAAYAICNASIKQEEANERHMVVELPALTFEDSGDNKKKTWIQVFSLGELDHPYWGKIDITEEKCKQFAANVNSNIRGIQLDIDYAHKGDISKGSKAAGWIQKAEARGKDGLWVEVEFTSIAAEEIQNGEWKYFSADFDWEWVDPKSKNKYENVLFGGALTNRPFVKDLAPINLSELIDTVELDDLFDVPDGKFAQEESHYRMADSSTRRCLNCTFYRDGACLVVEGEIEPDYVSDYFQAMYRDDHLFFEEEVNDLKRGELAQLLGLKEEATDEEFSSRIKQLADAEDKNKQLQEELDKRPEEVTPEAKKFAEEYPEQHRQMMEQKEALKLAEVNGKLQTWNAEHQESHFGIPPSLNESLRDVRLGLDGELAVKFDEFVGNLHKTGLVDFQEDGGNKEPEGDSGGGEFVQKVKQLQEEKNISFQEASRQVARANPELADEWRKGVKKVG